MTPELKQEAAELLERAADGFESGRYSWTTGAYRRVVFGTEAYCSVGALAHEAGLEVRGKSMTRKGEEAPGFGVALKTLSNMLPAHWPFFYQDNIIKWNDAITLDFDNNPKKARTKAEVIELMKHAAKDLRNG